jgi:hypothetical protein
MRRRSRSRNRTNKTRMLSITVSIIRKLNGPIYWKNFNFPPFSPITAGLLLSHQQVPLRRIFGTVFSFVDVYPNNLSTRNFIIIKRRPLLRNVMLRSCRSCVLLVRDSGLRPEKSRITTEDPTQKEAAKLRLIVEYENCIHDRWVCSINKETIGRRQ